VTPHTVIFDLGGVLVDWDPRYLFRKLIADEDEMESFLTTVCNQDWNEQQDAGRPFAEAVALLTETHPEHAELIRAYDERWGEMVAGAIGGTVTLLEELSTAGVRLLALTNWSAEKFPLARERFDFLARFEGIVVSGEEHTRKPFPRIYEILFERYDVEPRSSLFIDDSQTNVEEGRRLGLQCIRFCGANPLRDALSRLGLLTTEP
jgi:2-haloacid dehalogenase